MSENVSVPVSKAEPDPDVLSHKRNLFRSLNLLLMLITCHSYGHPRLDLGPQPPQNKSSQSVVLSKYILKALEGVAQLLVLNKEITAATLVVTEGGSGLARPPFTRPLLQLNCVVTHSTEDEESDGPHDGAKQPAFHEGRKSDKVDGASKGQGNEGGSRIGGADGDEDGQKQNIITKCFQRVSSMVFLCCKNPERPEPTAKTPSPPEERIQLLTDQESPDGGETSEPSDRGPNLETRSQSPIDSGDHLATPLPDFQPEGNSLIKDWLPKDFLMSLATSKRNKDPLSWADHAATLVDFLAKHNDVTKNNPERIGDLVQNGHIYLMNITKAKSIVRFARWSSSGYICNLGDLLANGEDIFKAWFAKWESGRTRQDETNTGKFSNALLAENISKLDDILSATTGNPFMKPAKLEKLAKHATELTSLCVSGFQSKDLSVELECRKASDAFYNLDTCFEFHQFLVATIFRYRDAHLELSKLKEVPKTGSSSNDSPSPSNDSSSPSNDSSSPSNDSSSPSNDSPSPSNDSPSPSNDSPSPSNDSPSPQDIELRNTIRRAYTYCERLWMIVHSKAFEDHMSMLGHNKAINLPTHKHYDYYKCRMAGGPVHTTCDESVVHQDSGSLKDSENTMGESRLMFNAEETGKGEDRAGNEVDPRNVGVGVGEDFDEDFDEGEGEGEGGGQDEDEDEDKDEDEDEDEDENMKGKVADGVKVKDSAVETTLKWARRLVDHWQSFENVIAFCNGAPFDVKRDVKISLLDIHPPDPSPVMINQETWQAIIRDLKDESGWEDFQDQSFLDDLREWVTNGEAQPSIDTPTCMKLRKNFEHAFENGGALKFQACRHCEAELGSIMTSKGAHPLCHAMKMCCLKDKSIIGVSKLCCPICWDLLKILCPESRFHVRGRHSTLFPVELPDFLSEDQLDQMIRIYRQYLLDEVRKSSLYSTVPSTAERERRLSGQSISSAHSINTDGVYYRLRPMQVDDV